MRTREWRRAQRDRLTARRRHYHSVGAPNDPARVGRITTTPCPCSCALCGNPRRRSKGQDRYTIQERRVTAR